MIAGYNSREPMCFRYIIRMIAMRINVRGFLYGDYVSRLDEFYRDMGEWVASGKVKSHETVFDGLERMPEAFLGLFERRQHRQDAGEGLAGLELAGGRVAGFETPAKRRLALLRRAVGEAFRNHPALGIALQRVVADRLGGAHALLDVAGLEDRAVLVASIGRPNAGVAVGLELDRDLDLVAFDPAGGAPAPGCASSSVPVRF
jgi:hypothetical protein